MTTKHTLLPWRIYGGCYLPIVATVNGKPAQIGRLESGGQLSSEEIEANADFLDKAVNSHEAVYSVLQRCYDVVLEGELKHDIKQALQQMRGS